MRNKRVMIIDDDIDFLEELRETLALSGYELVAVNDPLQATRQVQEIKPALIIVDLKMPGKNGFQVTNEIHQIKEFSQTPVLAMTGFFKEELLPLMKLCGISKCLKKPFQPLDVIMCIEDSLPNNHDCHLTSNSY